MGDKAAKRTAADQLEKLDARDNGDAPAHPDDAAALALFGRVADAMERIAGALEKIADRVDIRFPGSGSPQP